MTEDEDKEPDEQNQDEETEQEENIEEEEVTEDESAEQEKESAEVTHVESDSDGLLQKMEGFSVSKLLVIGAMFGLLAGLIAGYALSPSGGPNGQPVQATQALNQMVDSSRFNGTIDVGEPVDRNGMFYYNVTMNQRTQNGTQTNYRQFYMTKDAELMFPVIQGNPFAPSMPINVQEYLAQQGSPQQQTRNGTAP